MKILITTDCYTPVINGVVTSVVLLKQELEARGHEVRVVTLSSSLHSYREGDVYYVGSISAEKIYPGVRLKLDRTGPLSRELVAWGPEIVHSQCEFSTFRIACVISDRLHIPIVHTYHTVYEDYTHYFSPSVRLGRHVVSVFSRWVGLQTACIVAPTRKVERLLRDYGVACRVEVIPTGVDLAAYQGETSSERLAQLRRQWQLPEDKTILLYLGRMAKEKNLETLMEQIAAAGRQDCHLLMVGDGPHREEALTCAKRLGLSVTSTGMVPHDQVPDYYHLGDLFVTASTSETQGLTYLEALASGVPVLCLRDPCVEGVVEDGVNGWQYGDSREFGLRLSEFCSSPDRQAAMSQAARQSALRFSGQAFAASAENLYRSLLEEQSCPQVQ